MTLRRAASAEAIGTAMLLAIVVGSGIMGERLAEGNAAVTLLAKFYCNWSRSLLFDCDVRAGLWCALQSCCVGSERLEWPTFLARQCGLYGRAAIRSLCWSCNRARDGWVFLHNQYLFLPL